MEGPPTSFSFQAGYEHPTSTPPDDDPDKAAGTKVPKRKRLTKACNSCHKSKRRCDGTAPCSNCYFASKPCQYTDAFGREVSAPHPGKPDASKLPRGSSLRSKSRVEDGVARSISLSSLDIGESHQARKRAKTKPSSQPLPINHEAPSDPICIEDGTAGCISAAAVLDIGTTRELTNLFFAHCHPVRAIIHKPTFSVSLSHEPSKVPAHLLLAICALAAPLSRQLRFRSAVPSLRFAGRPFADAAASMMFDDDNRLSCDADIYAAQALCILMFHELQARETTSGCTLPHRELILQIVETLLGTQSEVESIQATLERECLRRISWVVYVAELQLSIWTQRPALLAESQLHSRLPVDETCFELAPLAGVTEYLHTAGQHASEWGHLVRIHSLYAQAELNLGRLDLSLSALTDLEKSGEDWVSNLPEALQFSEQNLQVQISMFETASNTGAWCFCYMHILFTGLSLALHWGKYLLSHVSVSQKPPWAVSRLDLLLGALGDRAKNSMILGSYLWIQIRHLGREDVQLRKLCSEYEAASGTRIIELASAASFPPRTPMLLPPTSQSLLPSRSLNDLRVHRQSSWSNSYPPIGSLPLAVEGEMKPIGRLAESLPSLKSSGLLDSWNPAHSRPGGEGSSNSRSGPPVGLQWLANESR